VRARLPLEHKDREAAGASASACTPGLAGDVIDAKILEAGSGR
jgi:hypothetical protein